MPPGFQPRAGLLAELDHANGPVVHAVTGIQGAGKTQLAAAYARAKLAASWRLVAWVNAADPGVLGAGLAEVAEALGLADGRTGRDGGDAGGAVRDWLERDGRRCLVVFDNALDPDGIRPVLPACGAARVLITGSRRPVAGLGAGVPVDVFSPDEALAFLAARTGLADTAGARALARELGYLPLALAQAAGVIAAHDLAYWTYLGRLRAMPAAARLAREEGQPYPHGVAEAIMLSLDSVRAGDRGGVDTGIMEVTSVLSAGGVRRELLHDAGRAGVLTAGRDRAEVPTDLVDVALARLVERSLLTFSLDGETVIAHHLVMRVVRDALADEERLTAVCRNAACVLRNRARSLVRSPDRPAVRDIAEQVAALHETAGPAGEADGELAGTMLRLRSWALYYQAVLGDGAAQAIDAGEAVAADSARLLGPDHPDTLASWNNLAIACQEAGRKAEAVRLHERALAGRVRTLGPEHPDTLASRNNLAIACQEVGRKAEAVRLHERALAGREQVLGPDHPDTLASRNNLATAYQQMGWAAEAISSFRRALAGREQVLGPDHPDTLAARNGLAAACQEVGWAGEAIALFEQTLAGRVRVLGPAHPDTLASRNNLGHAYQEAGRVPEAIAQFEQALTVGTRALGAAHPTTVSSRVNLASAYRDAGL
ncbi:MAG TPA: tetratricopeptide repeat protein [Streptosporangiaceae bacterium]|nr:tetratricopeptide repeat protein [Streptosporangiaceae bacterium]